MKKTAIPKMTKLPYKKIAKEIDASMKSDVQKFFEKTKFQYKAQQNPEKPYLLYPHTKPHQVVESSHTRAVCR
jgi:hypothetical protein